MLLKQKYVDQGVTQHLCVPYLVFFSLCQNLSPVDFFLNRKLI